MEREATSVLVVGGSLVGLSAAMFLAWRGVPVVLVERHPGSSAHPRALGFMTRTAELYRSVGLGSLPQVPPGMGRPRRVPVESLAGRWGDELIWSQEPNVAEAPPTAAGRIEYSPCSGIGLGQDKLEPVLRERATQLGAHLRLAAQMVSFEQDGEGVAAVVRQKDGREYSIRADYMIAADGNASPVRETLNIGRTGLGYLATVRSILFRGPAFLEKYLERGPSQFVFRTPEIKGTLVSYRDTRWALMLEDDVDRDDETLTALAVMAIGHPDVTAKDIQIIAYGRWVLNALVADKFSSGRIFLAGDSAHAFPPARGGYGANTGIEDAHNLAWKIASVLSGVSKPALLDTYDAERRPIAWLRHGQIFNRQDYANVARPSDKEIPIINDDAMELGQLYRSKAVLGVGDDLPAARKPDQWAGQPGTRAPHFWLTKGDERLSALDLLGRDWVLVAEDDSWTAAAANAEHQLGIKVGCVIFGSTASSAPNHVGPPMVDDGKFTADTAIAQLVANPASLTVLQKIFPGLVEHQTYERFKVMSLRQLQPMSQGLITDEGLVRAHEALAAIEVDAPPVNQQAPEKFESTFRSAFGIGRTGASLVRPDGYIAWRVADLPVDRARAVTAASRTSMLVDVLKQVASTVR